ncbi:hypothetical protein VHUM_00874 [Vanrija humicola]|uniref:Nuclear pore complex protein Nup160 n=1 Tax=Vanrija humicola TaxID=5417 RepID=A0A7D8V3K7_VANHU|nr:hypothetical protein VHUM_00874 [Vanrija humicola]
MSIYTPFQLAHTSLPAPITTTSGVAREVAVPTQRPFPPEDDNEIFNSPLNADHAASAAFEPRTATLARALDNEYTLELRSLSPVINHSRSSGNPQILRILLPDPIRPLTDGCIVPDVRGRRLTIIALTHTNVVYRFTFPLTAFIDKGDRVAFITTDVEWVEEFEIDPDLISSAGGIGSWAVTNANTVILGCGDGGIIKVQRDERSTLENPIWAESHHKGHSRWGFFGRSNDETVTSIAEFESAADDFPVLYTFSRDWKLRTWSLATAQSLKSTDVRPSSESGSQLTTTGNSGPATSADTTSSLIRVLAHPNPSSKYSHIVVVFVPTPYNSSSPGTFVFYRASHSSSHVNDLEYAGERPGAPWSAGSQLRGFEVQPPTRTDGVDGWRLWAVWDTKGSLSVDSVPVNDILQFSTYVAPPIKPRMVLEWQRVDHADNVEAFDAAYFDNLLSLSPPDPTNPYDNSDISETFVQYLLFPGRFSQLTLTTALDNYIDQLPLSTRESLKSRAFPTLSQKFIAAVGSDLKMETSPQTGAPVVDAYRKALKLQWLGIWARVRGLDKQARWPVATGSLNGQLLILDREGASVPVQEDSAGVLVHLSKNGKQASEFQALPEGSLLAFYPALAPPQSRRSLTALAIAGQRLAAALERSDDLDEAGTALDAFTTTVRNELAAAPTVPVEDIAAGWWESGVEPFLNDTVRSEVKASLDGISSLPRTLLEALDILAATPPATAEEKIADDWTFSGFGNALLSSTISNLVTARYNLALNVLLVSLYYLENSSADEDDELFQVLTRAQVTFQRYSVLHWLVEQTGEDAAERRVKRKRTGARDEVHAKLAGLNVRDSGDEGSDVDGYDLAYSLLHSLLSRTLPQPVPVDTAASLFDASNAFLSNLNILGEDQVDIEPRDDDVKLSAAVLADGHAATARDLIDQYPPSSGLAYVRGKALLETGDAEDGVHELQLAAAGCQDGSLAPVLPSAVGSDGLGAYYRHVMGVVDEHGLQAAVAAFGERALEAVGPEEKSMRDVWTRVFLAYLTLGQYEDAYSTLTATPFYDMRDLLGQLISTMCEANEVGRLNKLGFIGFQQEVEERLNYKARNSDPLRFPNYYKVLYSWHISRGDYRSAGEIMYAQGRRFAEASSSKLQSFEVSAMRARSYLTAINALSLVDKRNAWITVAASPENMKRRKVTSYIPEDEFAVGSQPVNIITLADIQAEYTAVLSQLRLSSYIPDLHEHGVSLTPDEIVGFFTQRSLFDLALSSAADMDVDMTDIFQTLATRCVELSRVPSMAADNPAVAFLSASPVTARLRGPPSALALRYLEVALDRRDGLSTQYKYRDTVANTFFELNEDARSGWQMPVWLVEHELKRDAEGWISRAVDKGWVKEAVEWTAEVLRRAQPPDLLPAGKEFAADIPYNLVDRVLAAAGQGEEKSDRALQAAAKALREVVDRRASGLKSLRQ